MWQTVPQNIALNADNFVAIVCLSNKNVAKDNSGINFQIMDPKVKTISDA